MTEVKRAKCTNDVVVIGNSTFYGAFTKGRVYEVYFEDNGRSIWAYNNKGRDHMLRDFEISDSFFDKHFEILQ